MCSITALANKLAVSDIAVLILGETGVGKGVVARLIHERSPRRHKPMLALNGATLSETLIESELFGHERGSFTGAIHAKIGLLESADGGTVFLDEIGELPMPVQVKLLRLLEEREFIRVGGVRPRSIDIRFIASTHVDLSTAIARGQFRPDLFFRLNGMTVKIPPLRERVEEIDLLARDFLRMAAHTVGLPGPPPLPECTLAWLRSYPWPGNVRELRNSMERAILLCGDGPVLAEHLAPYSMPTPLAVRLDRAQPPTAGTSATQISIEHGGPVAAARDERSAGAGDDLPLAEAMREAKREVERRYVREALRRTAGNQIEAAKLLTISRRTLLNKLDELRIERPRKR